MSSKFERVGNLRRYTPRTALAATAIAAATLFGTFAPASAKEPVKSSQAKAHYSSKLPKTEAGALARLRRMIKNGQNVPIANYNVDQFELDPTIPGGTKFCRRSHPLVVRYGDPTEARTNPLLVGLEQTNRKLGLKGLKLIILGRKGEVKVVKDPMARRLDYPAGTRNNPMGQVKLLAGKPVMVVSDPSKRNNSGEPTDLVPIGIGTRLGCVTPEPRPVEPQQTVTTAAATVSFNMAA